VHRIAAPRGPGRQVVAISRGDSEEAAYLRAIEKLIRFPPATDAAEFPRQPPPRQLSAAQRARPLASCHPATHQRGRGNTPPRQIDASQLRKAAALAAVAFLHRSGRSTPQHRLVVSVKTVIGRIATSGRF